MTSDGPTLFDFANPLELRVETIAAAIDPLGEGGAEGGNATDEADVGSEEADAGGNGDNITAELARLFEEGSAPQPIDGVVKKAEKRQDR